MDEKTPLLSAEAPRQPPSGHFVSNAQTHLVDDQPTVNCQVCNNLVTIENLEKQMVVRCPSCSEATPIKGPPPGKQYVRCPCNCLLICSTTTTKVGCPRPSCQKVIVLHENDSTLPNRPDNLAHQRGIQDPYNPGGTFGASSSLRVICGNCSSPFSVAPPQPPMHSRPSRLISCLSGGTAAGRAGLITARCPRCHKTTSVGPAYARVHLAIYGFFALLALIIAVSVTVGTAHSAKENKALYFLWSVLYLIVLVLGLRAVLFLVMPVSSADVPVLQL